MKLKISPFLTILHKVIRILIHYLYSKSFSNNLFYSILHPLFESLCFPLWTWKFENYIIMFFWLKVGVIKDFHINLHRFPMIECLPAKYLFLYWNLHLLQLYFEFQPILQGFLYFTNDDYILYTFPLRFYIEFQ